MDNLSIKQRFVLLIGIIIAIGLLTIFQAWRTMQPLVDDFNTYLEEVSERRHLLEQMDLALGYGGAIHQFKNYVLRGTDKYYDRYIQKYEWFQDILGKYRSLPNLSNVEGQALTDIADTIALYRKNLDLARDLIQQGKTTKEIDGIIKISDKPALDALNTLGDEMQTLTTNSHATLELHLEEGMAGMIGSVTLSLALVIIGCLWIYASIAVPLNRAVSAMEDIAQGNGDLTQRLEAKGRNELAMLAGSFNTFIGKIQDLVGRTHSTSQQLAAAAEETSIISGETSQGIQKQHQETDRVVSAMSEIANASDDVGQHADQAEEAAERAMKEAEKGRTVVDQAVQSINGLAAEVQRASEVIHRLEQDTNTIGAVLDVIGGIAEQTNLLALNAAIEAARAGEQGRGFAVVADEVRSLASRTQEATAEIQSMIERLQNGANDAVTVMNEGRERANTSVEQAGQAGSSLAEITTAVSGITALNRNIVNALEGQNQMTQGVNGGLHNISQVAESTAQGAAQTAQASQDLARLASELQTTVQQFRV